jgi:hypothetical protein
MGLLAVYAAPALLAVPASTEPYPLCRPCPQVQSPTRFVGRARKYRALPAL